MSADFSKEERAPASPPPGAPRKKLSRRLNEAGLTFCMMLPVYLAVLASPSVDSTVLRVAGCIGALTGLLNVVEFFLNASYGWWMGIVHLPLLAMSIYAFVLGMQKPGSRPVVNARGEMAHPNEASLPVHSRHPSHASRKMVKTGGEL
jgi:hypothetical protein